MRTHGHREGSITHWGLLRGTRGRAVWGRSWGGITWGEMPDIGDGDGGSKLHCHVCTYATILHVLHTYCTHKIEKAQMNNIKNDMGDVPAAAMEGKDTVKDSASFKLTHLTT